MTEVVVVGGGFYGCAVALAARQTGAQVVLLEGRDDLLTGASTVNQARVHGGYHYPRAVTTAARSRAHYRTFLADYAGAVVTPTASVYALAHGSLTGPRKLLRLCAVIGAPVEPAPPELARLFDRRTVQGAWLVEEALFDTTALRALLGARLADAGVEVRRSTPVHALREEPGRVVVETGAGDLVADAALVCTYGELDAGLPGASLRCEPCEVALVDVPPELAGLAVTVMDGPYFSLLPHPAEGRHALTHVRYTPHGAHPTFAGAAAAVRSGLPSRAGRMLRDAARYLPAVAGARHVGSMWGVKVVPATRDHDDARPILVRRSAGGRVVSLLGSKLDTVYDALEVTRRVLEALSSGPVLVEDGPS